MKNLFIESKKIYSNKIIDLLYLKIYKDFLDIYKKAMKISNNDEIKNFQTLIRSIPEWDNIKLEETKNILLSSNKELIIKLLKAISKINYLILLNTDKILEINDEILKKFIHNIYKFVYVIVWDNPFLFYHDLEPEILKKNQRELYIIIKESISKAIDELIDLNLIVDEFLNLDLNKDDKILKILLEKVINIENNIDNKVNIKQIGGNDKLNISEILNNNNIKITDSNLNNKIEKGNNTDLSLTNTNNDTKRNMSSETLDAKIENIVENDLKIEDSKELNVDDNSENEDEQKNTYQPEESDKYQEVFSNSEIVNTSLNSMNSIQKGENLKRNKFFSNYLNF